jgi:arylsulfatase A-like enzyme
MGKRIIILQSIFFVLTGLIIGCTTANKKQQPEKPNIILVMADDQGWGDTGYNGHPYVKTPNLDAMAKESVVFDRFYAAAPVCSPTRASVMTGRTPMRTNVVNHGHYMRPNEITIAEALKTAGYVTGFFGKSHIGSVQKESPTCPGQFGFDEWLAGLNFFDLDPYLSRNGEFVHLKGQGTVITMDAALEFITKHKDDGKPMFVVSWFPAPHNPHLEKPVDFAGSDTLYDNEEKWRGYYLETTLMDQQVGRLRKALRDLKIENNTIVWFCSDNGGLNRETSGGREKKGSIYEGGLRIPGMLEWPDKFKPEHISTPATTMDIYPTLLKIVNVKMENQPRLDGMDLSGIIKGTEQTHCPVGFWHNYEKGQLTYSDRIIKRLMEAQLAGESTPFPERILKNVKEFPKLERGKYNGHAAWLKWPWKLHRIEKNGQVQIELYNLETEPMEANDVASEEKEKTANMLQELENWQASVFDSLEGKDYK